GIALHPHPRLQTFGRERAVLIKAMLHVEARAADRGDRGLDRHFVAEPGWEEETRIGVDQRMAGQVVGLEVIYFSHAERPLDQRRGAGVEDGEVARVIDDAGGVAIAPLDAHHAVVDEHAPPTLPPPGARPRAPSARITSPVTQGSSPMFPTP